MRAPLLGFIVDRFLYGWDIAVTSRLNPRNDSTYHKVAKLDLPSYEALVTMDNRSFMEIRNDLLRISATPNSDLEALQTSFYSNGVTGVPDFLEADAVWNAGAQHDFAYTVGPLVYGEVTVPAGLAEKERADRLFTAQIENQPDSIGVINDLHASLKGFFLYYLGHRFYKASDNVSLKVYSLAEITTEIANASNGSQRVPRSVSSSDDAGAWDAEGGVGVGGEWNADAGTGGDVEPVSGNREDGWSR